MKPIADTRRLTLARRLASGLPAWAVARASNISDEDLEALVVESGFAELVNAMAELMAMDEAARLEKLYRIAQQVLTAAILTFAHTLGEFGVVLMVGGNLPGETRTLSVAIYDRMQAFDDRSAGIMAATLLVVAVVTLMATTMLSRRVGPGRA